MEISLSYDKTAEQNASEYYEKAKKAKKKIEGAVVALQESRKELERLKKLEEKEILEFVKEEQKTEVKRHWYEKFRWFFTSGGFLAIGGRDATTNEILIKKHMEKKDLVFHSEVTGSPFFVLKSEGKDIEEIDDISKEEVASATAIYSRAWKRGLYGVDVFYVNPDQVSKTSMSGEFVPKGSFMIRGKKNTISPSMDFGVGIKEDGRFIAGPLRPIKNSSKKFISVKQGNMKLSESSKRIKKELGYDDLDEISRMLPTGGCFVK